MKTKRTPKQRTAASVNKANAHFWEKQNAELRENMDRPGAADAIGGAIARDMKERRFHEWRDVYSLAKEVALVIDDARPAITKDLRRPQAKAGRKSGENRRKDTEERDNAICARHAELCKSGQKRSAAGKLGQIYGLSPKQIREIIKKRT